MRFSRDELTKYVLPVTRECFDKLVERACQAAEGAGKENERNVSASVFADVAAKAYAYALFLVGPEHRLDVGTRIIDVALAVESDLLAVSGKTPGAGGSGAPNELGFPLPGPKGLN